MSRHTRRRARTAHWPLDFWVPGEGWIASSCMTEIQREQSIDRADRFGDTRRPVSGWQEEGVAAAESIGLGVLAAYPPGPGDSPDSASLMASRVADALLLPTSQFRRGMRVYGITEYGMRICDERERALEDGEANE